MFAKADQRSSSYSDEVYGSEPTEKTIPFLRRLVDMLSENENVISFCPGSVKNGQVTLGRIVVHDRIKVENEILPRYFNHSSFASLRRQLNYFSFTRIGKGRQKGATYCNEGVIAIEDILRLRRRSTTTTTTNGGGSASEGSGVSGGSRVVTKAVSSLSPKRTSMTSSSSIVSPRNTTMKSKRNLFESSSALQQSCQQPLKKFKGSNEGALRIDAPRPTLVSPITSPLHTPSTSPSEALQVSLDLTVPQYPRTTNSHEPPAVVSSNSNNDGMAAHRNHSSSSSYLEDPDILAGCRALLCFSHGLHSLTA